MKIYNGTADFPEIKNPIVTSGTFDGVHQGHQKILKRLKQIAKKEQGEVVLLTFWPHPRLVLFPKQDLMLINTFEEKAELLAKEGVDHLIKIPFTEEFSKLSSEEFIRRMLIDEIGTHKLVIGYNHRFGRNREGSFDYLKEHESDFGFMVEEIPKQEVDDIGVSSTNIRKAVLEGNVLLANEFMGHEFELSGEVVHGDKIGHQLGFPTANIFVNSANKLIPADGVYAVKVHVLEEEYEGMLYIGNRPTLDGRSRTIEVNIFDFNRNIYAADIKVTFVCQARGDMKFDGLEALKKQLELDRVETKKLLNIHG